MRISKELAEKIAYKMTLVTYEKVKELKEAFCYAVTELYKKEIPAEVAELFKKYPSYVNTNSQIRLNGNGWNYEHVNLAENVPSDNNGYDTLVPTSKQSDALKKLKHQYEDAQKAYKKLLSDTENALLMLRTFARIKEQLPEAEKYLPPPMSNALVVNFENLQDRLKKQPVTKVSEKETTNA